MTVAKSYDKKQVESKKSPLVSPPKPYSVGLL